jgi:hypothetical protein
MIVAQASRAVRSTPVGVQNYAVAATEDFSDFTAAQPNRDDFSSNDHSQSQK